MIITEQRYAQTKIEALVPMRACEQFTDFLKGLDFTIQTDHKSQVPLFSIKALEELLMSAEISFKNYEISILNSTHSWKESDCS